MPTNQQPVTAAEMTAALTAAPLRFSDGAMQTFTADGRTTYTEHGRPSVGEWSVVADGTFESFWPPSYRATYEIRWIVEDGVAVGLSFTDPGQREADSGSGFHGRYT